MNKNRKISVSVARTKGNRDFSHSPRQIAHFPLNLRTKFANSPLNLRAKYHVLHKYMEPITLIRKAVEKQFG